MKNYFKILTCVIVAAFTFSACSKKDVQPDAVPLKSAISVKIKSGNLVSKITVIPEQKGAEASITWSSYNLTLGAVSFSGTKDGSLNQSVAVLDKEFEFQNGSKIDFIGTSLIPDGSYSKSAYKLNLKARTGNVFEISGIYTNVKGIDYNIKFVCKQEVIAIAVCEDKIFKSGENYTGDLTVDWDKLSLNITTVDLEGATYITKNSILIDETNNSALYAKLKDNLSTIAHFTYN